MKPLLLVFVVCPLVAFATTPATTLAHLSGSQIKAVKTDAAGNIYIAGFQGSLPAAHAFLSKVSPTGNVLYSTTFAGSKTDVAGAIDVDSTGAAYITGQTTSPDFPVTTGALQTTLQSPNGQAFVAKVDPAGKVVYATFIGGSALINPGANGLVVDSAGEAFISGQTIGGTFPSTPGAPFTSSDGNTVFVMKIDATAGKLLAAVRGIGGLLALDTQGNVYIAGAQNGANTSIPTTPGAFQRSYVLQACGGDAQLAFGCSYQYVTKLNASLTQIAYSTYLAGSYGATPAGMSVDTQGTVWVAGTTSSYDYPITPNAYQPSYIAGAPPPPSNSCLFFCVYPPAATGFLTQLNATGTGLIYSTFFSGTVTDTITFAAFATNGIYVSGTAGSPDLPGFAGFPAQCLPQGYATRMSADATEVGAARQVPGQILAYDAAANVLIAWTGSDLVTFDPTAPPNPVACVLDAADLRPVTSIAPGELLSVFGRRLAGSVIAQASGQFATSLGGISVAINGIPSPLLYAGRQQINFQAPFEIAGAAQANLTFANTELSLSDSRTLAVLASNPVAFIDTATSLASLASCPLNNGLSFTGGPEPLAFNADGTRNSCANPTAPGSVVQIFLAGLGVTSPAQATGAITPNPGPPLNLPFTFAGGLEATVVSASAAPGLISGVWQVAIRMPTNHTGAVSVSPSVAGVPVRDTSLTVWVH
jgi:uncharacterized protein (TIGR03437 family)